MPLEGKYLKYSPEITPEIFTLVWDKLIKSGCKFEYFKEIIFERFKIYNRVLRYESNRNYVYPLTGNNSCKETTVQEILGYDPFVKDDFVLPNKWCIKHTNNKELHEFFENYNHGGYSGSSNNFLHYPRFNGSNCLSLEIKSGYTEITFDQFKKYVLKESIEEIKVMEKDWSKTNKEELLEEAKRRYPTGCKFNSFSRNEVVCEEVWYIDSYNQVWIRGSGAFNGICFRNGKWAEITFLPETKIENKKVIPEYVECIKDIYGLKIGKVYPVVSNIIMDGRYDNYSIINNNRIKPSTKEAFDAQNKPIEKWSVGSYVVFLKDYLQNNGRKKGDISKITKIRKDAIEFEDNIGNNIDGEFSVVTNLKWFATKFEAEEFAKTLINSKKLLSLNNWYQSGNHTVYLYERNKVYGFHHDKWFASEGFSENDLKYVDSNTVEEKFTNYIKNNYLIGQSFIDLVNKIDFQIKSYDLNFSNKTTQIYIPVEPNDLRGNKTARIFDKGVWAKCSSIKSNKQVVHCTTQEEWNFVTEKLGYKWKELSIWDIHKNNTCINLTEPGFITVKVAYKEYQILSFQEWCDLNGYKMEKKVKFEVGKWYKVVYKDTKQEYYLKYINNKYEFGYSEYILTSNGQHSLFHSGNNLNIMSIPIKVSIEEIQQYLPDDHPDKIKSNQESKIYSFKPLQPNDLEWEIKIPNSYHGIVFYSEPVPITKDNWKHEMLLSTNDEEFPMVNIIKTNTIKQLLNND